MPLLEIVGLTSTQQTFPVAFVLMKRETTGHYEWALERIALLFSGKKPEVIVTDRELGLIKAMPRVFADAKHILCEWHVYRNIESNSWWKSHSPSIQAKFMRDCHELFDSTTIAAYEARLLHMRDSWMDKYHLMEYLEKTWLDKYKEAIVRC